MYYFVSVPSPKIGGLPIRGKLIIKCISKEKKVVSLKRWSSNGGISQNRDFCSLILAFLYHILVPDFSRAVFARAEFVRAKNPFITIY